MRNTKPCFVTHERKRRRNARKKCFKHLFTFFRHRTFMNWYISPPPPHPTRWRWRSPVLEINDCKCNNLRFFRSASSSKLLENNTLFASGLESLISILRYLSKLLGTRTRQVYEKLWMIYRIIIRSENHGIKIHPLVRNRWPESLRREKYHKENKKRFTIICARVWHVENHTHWCLNARTT